ncbi:MAG: hypothetical protein Q8P59_06675, partial [Dehalococcoidia bacterium]|nr:hypothetical protein [Dehalococcoidia bacterium]
MKGPTFRVFLASLIVFSLAAILLAGRLDPAGDEPHYLLATYSLLADHDLDMANNYAAKDYERFFHTERYPPGALDDIATWKHAFDYKGDGRLYSVHNVGLSALLVPAYALGGRPGTALFMGLLAALLVTQVYAVCRSHTSRQMTTLLSWLPLVFSIPLMPFASTVYPEVPAALIVISAWRLVFEKDNPRPGHFLAVALLAALLPWFHVKYLAASAAILVICLVRWRKEI